MWRYAEMLPVRDPRFRFTLGEGLTPLLAMERLGERLGLSQLFAKDEGQNPTASFKARGLGMAVARAAELGVKALAIPSAGNAGSALAAYAARAGLPACIFLPQDVPPIFLAEMRALGAEVTLVDGLITDCAQAGAAGRGRGALVRPVHPQGAVPPGGQKDDGLRAGRAVRWRPARRDPLPDRRRHGLVGMWKAFDEMEALGWIGSERPRMVSVQSEGCAPIVRAFQQGSRTAEPWQNAATLADGLRVPAAVGDFLILDAIRASGGTAIAVPDDEIRAAIYEIGASEGLFVAPEAAATLVALRRLQAEGWLRPDERVLLFLTGSGLKYAHLIQ